MPSVESKKMRRKNVIEACSIECHAAQMRASDSEFWEGLVDQATLSDLNFSVSMCESLWRFLC